MGFDINGITFLLAARAAGVSFARTAMIGRQSLHITATHLNDRLRRFGMTKIRDTKTLLAAEQGYSEPLLKLIGAESVTSFDASPYEGASVVHDMNQPVAHEHHDHYSVVIDGGSLEHVFNFPQAMRNCMMMIAPGGHFLGITPANNLFGHGFYQFSPELFYRVFSAETGFAVERMYVVEYAPGASWMAVRDPAVVKKRVTLTNAFPTYLMVQARRVDGSKSLMRTPQQSDYVAEWSGINTVPPDSKRRIDVHWRLKKLVRQVTPGSRRTRFNPEFFHAVSLDQLVKGEPLK